jgi:hypothetical protein
MLTMDALRSSFDTAWRDDPAAVSLHERYAPIGLVASRSAGELRRIAEARSVAMAKENVARRDRSFAQDHGIRSREARHDGGAGAPALAVSAGT